MNSPASFHKIFHALILRPLLKDGFRTAVTVLGVAIGVAVFLAIRLANVATLASFEEKIDAFLGRADLMIHADGLGVDETVLARLTAFREQVRAYPVVEGYGVESASGEVVEFLGTDLSRDMGVQDVTLKTKRKGLSALLPLLLDPKGVILPEKFIPGTAHQPGDRMTFLINGREKTLRVTAILEHRGLGRALGGNFALLNLAAAQNIFDRKGKLDRIDIELLNGADLNAVKQRLTEALPGHLKVERPERKNQQVEKMLRAFQYNLTALSFVALLVGLYLIYNMMALSVVRRRVEIATLRALGATPVMVAGVFFLEAGIIGAAGSALGIVLGSAFAQVALDAVSLTVNNIYVASHATEIDFPWEEMGPYFLLGMGLSFVSALIPAWDAATTSPARVMRVGSYDLKQFRASGRLNRWALLSAGLAALFSQLPPIGGFPYFGFLAVFLLILAFSLFSPSALLIARALFHQPFKRLFGGEGLIACMNLSQNVGRNSLAVSALAIAFMMVVSMSIMVHSFRETVTIWIGETLKADLFGRVAGGRDTDYRTTLPAEGAEKLKALPGVAAVDLFRALDITYDDQPAVLATGDFSVLSAHGHLLIKAGAKARDLASLLAGQNRAIVSEAFSLKHSVNVGDTLKLDAPSGPLALEVAAVYHDYSRERGYIIVDRSTFLEHYRDSAINSFVVYLEDKSDLENVREKILGTLGKDIHLLLRSNGELKKDVLDVFDKTFAITYSLEIIAAVVAVLGLFNTLVSLILERRREIGILRFIGAYREQVKKMIYIEAGLLGLIGAAMGLMAGFLVSYLLIFVINKQSFGWTIQVHHPAGFLVTATFLFLAIALLAGHTPARMAARLNPREAVRVG